MGKMKKQQIIPIVLLLLISTLQWTVSAADKHHKKHHPHCNGDGDYTNCKISTPQECARKCRCNEEPRICYYKFVVERYLSQSNACDHNETQAQCVYGDGTQKSMLTINRKFPGDKIEVCKGDEIVVDVENTAPGIGTTIHWHGVFQNGTPYYDGVPLVTQCPISEGSTFRYNFRAENSGTHMYHSHDAAHMMEGLSGTLIVRDPDCTEPHKNLYNVDKHAIVISDMFDNTPNDHFPGYHNLRNAGQTASNIFLNGLGLNTGPNRKAAVAPKLATFEVKQGEYHRFRVENLCSTVCLSTLSIEGHNLTIIALDGESVKPFDVQRITSATGERYDFVVAAKNKVGTYWITVVGLGECADNKVWQLGQLVYTGSQGPVSPQPEKYEDISTDGVTFNPEDIHGCLENSPKSKCVYQATCVAGKLPPEILKPKKHVVITATIGFVFPPELEEFANGTYNRYFAATEQGVPTSSIINGVSNIDPASPPLTQEAGYDSPIQNSCPGEGCFGRQVHYVPLGHTVSMVICDKPGYAELNHPMHLHGFAFYVLAQGYNGGGNCTKADMENILAKADHRIRQGVNPCPAKKDTIIVPTGGWTVIRFVADNPGMWLFHCHFTWHHLTGMSFVLQVGKRSQFPVVPKGFPTCNNYMPPITCPRKNQE